MLLTFDFADTQHVLHKLFRYFLSITKSTDTTLFYVQRKNVQIYFGEIMLQKNTHKNI